MASDLEAGSDAGWRAYLHEQYKSHRDEYTTLIRDQPTLAAERLLDLFASDDPAILQFLAQFLLNIDKPQEERDVLWPIMEALWLSGFPLALLHVLSDRKWYEAAKVVIEPNLELNISTLSAVVRRDIYSLTHIYPIDIPLWATVSICNGCQVPHAIHRYDHIEGSQDRTSATM